MDEIRTLLGDIRADEQARLERQIGQGDLRFWWAGRVGVLSSVLALVVVALSTVAANRTVRRRARAEQALHVSEERLRVTMRSIGDAVIATDLAGRVTFINHVAVALTGWAIEEARGRPLDEIFRIINEDSRAPVESPVEHVLREGKIVGLANHTVLLTRSGGELPIDDSGAPIRDAEGTVMGVVLVFRDVSERRQQEAEREQLEREAAARAEAERASAMKDEFLAILSHELRSPLQGILGWLTVLRETGSDPTQQRALQAIDRGVRQQAQLVNDILDISRVVAGKLQIEREPVDLGGVVEECVDEAMPAAHERQLHLDSTMANCGAVVGDRRRLRQAVSNLLTNAIKFTPRGGRIDVGCHRDDARRRSSPSATPERESHRTCCRISSIAFAREEESCGRASQPAASASGCRSSARSSGSTAAASSPRAQGRGAGPPSPCDCRCSPTSRSRAEPGAMPVEQPASTLRGLNVLVVDDDTDTRESLSTLLCLRGAEVEAAESAARALEAFARQTPDVIVTDISMPDQDGYDLLAALRARGGHRTAPEDRRPHRLCEHGRPRARDRRRL